MIPCFASFGYYEMDAKRSRPYLTPESRRAEGLDDDWGDEVVSNIYVRDPNPLRGVLAQAARYLADGSCPIGLQTWRSAYWSG